MKLTAEISNTEAALLDTVVYKGKIMFSKQIHSRYKNTLQANRISRLPLGVKKGFVKGEALRLIHTNSSRATFEENVNKFESLLCDRGYPKRWIETLLSDIRIHREGISAEAKKKHESPNDIFPFVLQYHLAVPNLKHVLFEKWYLMQNFSTANFQRASTDIL